MKKLLSILLAVSLLAVCLGAFAEGEAPKKKLVVATNAEFAPFEYIGDDGTVQGFDADLIAALMEVMGYEYEWLNIEFDSIVSTLGGKSDIAAAAMTIREEAKENVIFSDPYYYAAQKIIVIEGSSITGVADLAGKRVGVQQGTTGDIYATDNVGCEVVRYTKALDAVMDVKNGRLDAVITDNAPCDYYAQAVGGLTVLPELLSDEYYGLAVSLNDGALMEEINKALAIIMENGTYDEIHAKYFVSTEEEGD